MSIVTFGRTLHSLYAAASDADLWPHALNEIEELTGSVGAVIGLVPKRADAPGLNLAGRFTDEQCAEYSRGYMSICPRTAYILAHPGEGIFYDSKIIDEAGMDRDPVYAWFGKHGLRYFVGSVAETPNYHVVFSLQRSAAQGHVQRPHIELFEALRPHLEQAVTLADRLGSLAARTSVTSAILERLSQAVFALDAAGKLVYCNNAGERLLAAGDGLTVEDQRLRPAAAELGPQFDRMLDDARSELAVRGGGWMRLRRTSGRAPYALFVSHLVSDGIQPTQRRPELLLVVSDPDTGIRLSPEALRSLFALTDAETQVAQAIVSGHSLSSAAALLGVRRETLRSHLKSILRKVGVSRQQDLVRKLVQLAFG